METGAAPLQVALDRLWQQFLPEMEERVRVLEETGQAARADGLSPEQQQAAKAAAHKLAGVLGTFGLDAGTLLAREAESLCSENLDSEAAARLAGIAVQLRLQVANRKQHQPAR